MDAVVKVDRKLLKEVEEFVKNNRFLFTSKKQVVNLALSEFLNQRKLDKGKEKGGKNE